MPGFLGRIFRRKKSKAQKPLKRKTPPARKGPPESEAEARKRLSASGSKFTPVPGMPGARVRRPFAVREEEEQELGGIKERVKPGAVVKPPAVKKKPGEL